MRGGILGHDGGQRHFCELTHVSPLNAAIQLVSYLPSIVSQDITSWEAMKLCDVSSKKR